MKRSKFGKILANRKMIKKILQYVREPELAGVVKTPQNYYETIKNQENRKRRPICLPYFGFYSSMNPSRVLGARGNQRLMT